MTNNNNNFLFYIWNVTCYTTHHLQVAETYCNFSAGFKLSLQPRHNSFLSNKVIRWGNVRLITIKEKTVLFSWCRNIWTRAMSVLYILYFSSKCFMLEFLSSVFVNSFTMNIMYQCCFVIMENYKTCVYRSWIMECRRVNVYLFVLTQKHRHFVCSLAILALLLFCKKHIVYCISAKLFIDLKNK